MTLFRQPNSCEIGTEYCEGVTGCFQTRPDLIRILSTNTDMTDSARDAAQWGVDKGLNTDHRKSTLNFEGRPLSSAETTSQVASCAVSCGRAASGSCMIFEFTQD